MKKQDLPFVREFTLNELEFVKDFKIAHLNNKRFIKFPLWDPDVTLILLVSSEDWDGTPGFKNIFCWEQIG